MDHTEGTMLNRTVENMTTGQIIVRNSRPLTYLLLLSVAFVAIIVSSLLCWFRKFKKSLSVYDNMNEGLEEPSQMNHYFGHCCNLTPIRKILHGRFGSHSPDSDSESVPILGKKEEKSLDLATHEDEKLSNDLGRTPNGKVLKQYSLQLPTKTNADIGMNKLVKYESASPLLGSKTYSVDSETGNDSDASSMKGGSLDSNERKAILYEKRKRTKCAGDSFDDPPHLGTILFKLEYDFDFFALIVTVHRASDLPVMDEQSGSCNPYIKLTLLPEKKHKARTRMLQNCRNAAYEEVFTFDNLPYAHLRNLSLHFLILSHDKFSRDDVIGEVNIPLQSIDLSSHPVVFCKDVEPTVKKRGHGLGELLVSLCYQPAASRLTVVVMKARNIPKMDLAGTADPYVKLTLQCGTHTTKKKTHIKKHTLNPVFNESFLFDVSSDEMSTSKLILDVMDYDIGKQDDKVGQIVVGCDAPDRLGCQQWKKMMANPRKQISEWHQIMNSSDFAKVTN